MNANPLSMIPGLETDEDRLLTLIQTATENAFRSETFRQAVRDVIYECAPQLSRNMPFMLQVAESLKSARFAADHLPLHKTFTHEKLRAHAIQLAPDDGLYLEFGVWKAYWLEKMAAMKPVRFYGFDSFEGIPDAWSIRRKGHFDLGGNMPAVPANVELIKGWFDQTLPDFVKKHPEPVAFIHIDCDLYSSTMTVLELLRSQLRVGTTIVLDDYFISPGWDKAEFKAFHDFIAAHQIEFEYLGYVTDTPGNAVGVRLTKI